MKSWVIFPKLACCLNFVYDLQYVVLKLFWLLSSFEHYLVHFAQRENEIFPCQYQIICHCQFDTNYFYCFYTNYLMWIGHFWQVDGDQLCVTVSDVCRDLDLSVLLSTCFSACWSASVCHLSVCTCPSVMSSPLSDCTLCCPL